jgi:hypothetical protein
LQRKKTWLLVVGCLLFSIVSLAQGIDFKEFSNLRKKHIAVAKDSVLLDTVSLGRSSFSIEGVSDSLYAIYPEQSLLVWKQKPKQDSVTVHYRALPFSFTKEYYHRLPPTERTPVVSMIYQHEDEENPIEKKSKLAYTGSYGRSISVGNNQSAALNSHFNLQASGYILDSVHLEAAIADNTLPFQPDGNTAKLQEFDQLFIRLSKNQHELQLGDYNLESSNSYFLKFFKRVQGAYYRDEWGKQKIGVSASVAKGQFARNIFQGQEGNQGPYKLKGNNNEIFFIVLAGTEKVYVDNMLMQRGENADYIINYNTAEIKFMPRKMITKDSRIQVEFEYQDKNYLNSLLYASDEIQVSKRWKMNLNVYSNQDAKNQPYLENLNGSQKQFLSQVGDSVQQAFYPNMALDTFGANKILYKKIDTTVNAVHYDSVFVYSVNPDSAKYALGFSFVGDGKGDYQLSTQNANGKVYEWLAPLNGKHQGSYAPVQLLIAPKKQQVFTLGNSFQIDSLKSLNVELALSNYDPNLFSSIDNSTHTGLAAKLEYVETRFSNHHTDSWQNKLSYEWVQARFKSIAPYRNVEFLRDWNVPYTAANADERIADWQSKFATKRKGTLAFRSSFYERGDDYKGNKNILSYDFQNTKWRTGFIGNVLRTDEKTQQTIYYRPSVFAEYNFKKLYNTTLGARADVEQNEFRNKPTDTLLANSFAYDILTAYIRNDEQHTIRWNLNYFVRKDRKIANNDFFQQSHNRNLSLKLSMGNWEHHLLNFTGTYRKLFVDNFTNTTLKPEETFLGRMEYAGKLWKQLMSMNSLYEFGSGQEQKRIYTFVEVPAGQGVYMWNDYNNDHIQQANEFEIAIYPDQKRYIKIFSPTNDYVKVNYLNFSYSLSLEPQNYWQGAEIHSFKKLLTKFSSQTSLQVSNRLADNGNIQIYNPFNSTLGDTNIIITNNSFFQTLYYNRNNPRYGIDYNYNANTGKQLLVYGIEGSNSRQHQLKFRWNCTSQLLLNLTAKTSLRAYASALNDKRSNQIRNLAMEPSLSFMLRSTIRLSGGLRYEDKQNAPQFGGEKANIRGCNLELRFSQPNAGVFNCRASFLSIDYNGITSDPIAFTLLEALQKGSNVTWSAQWERRIGKGLELSLNYDGRQPATGAIIHTGRMSIRASL